MNKKFITYYIVMLLILLTLFWLPLFKKNQSVPLWQIRSIDTVKFSRDLARDKTASSQFKDTVDKQISDISSTGANIVAVGTPYDEEFIPFLKIWVKSARDHKLNVWFRGNFSGWEGWFEYQPITSLEHKQKIKEFIINNPGLFEDGDIFTSCTECENGALGDPRKTEEVVAYREFLIDEYKISSEAFTKIGKKVTPGYYSMNYDVAVLIMDKFTTQNTGGVVVIDHYLSDPNQLNRDINNLIDISSGKLVFGEIGAPIPDIHGVMTEEDQASWLDQALVNISQHPQVIGINYWANMGSSSHLWNDISKPRKAVGVLQKYYQKQIVLN